MKNVFCYMLCIQCSTLKIGVGNKVIVSGKIN